VAWRLTAAGLGKAAAQELELMVLLRGCFGLVLIGYLFLVLLKHVGFLELASRWSWKVSLLLETRLLHMVLMCLLNLLRVMAEPCCQLFCLKQS
jgi:hypothetical protein